MKNGMKNLALILSVVFALCAVFFGNMYAQSRTRNETGTSTEKQHKVATSGIEGQIASLYFSDKKDFLSKDISSEQISAVEDSLSEASKLEKFATEIKDVNERFTIQKNLNQLFEEPALNGNTFNEDNVLKSGVGSSEIKKLATQINQVSKQDAFHESILAYLSAFTDSDLASTDRSEAVIQAEERINEIVEDGTVISGFTMEQYLAARDAIKALPESSDKERLLDKLALAEQAMTNMGIEYE